MFSNAHAVVLVSAFAIAVVMGAVMNKTHFCTMGGVSDWVNMGDTGRMRAWVFAMAVALAGALALEATGTVDLDTDVFPRTAPPDSRGCATSSAGSSSASA